MLIAALLGFNVIDAFTTTTQKQQGNVVGTRYHSMDSQLRVASPIDAATTESIPDYDNNDDNISANTSVEFPPPLSSFDRFKRAATFWSTCLPIVASYYGLIGQLKFQEIFGDKLTEELIEKQWDEKHHDGAIKLSEAVTELKGFYVKTAQIISSRQDLFPEQYTDALSGFTDNLDPMPASLANAVVTQELLNRDEKFEDVFVEFDDEIVLATHPTLRIDQNSGLCQNQFYLVSSINSIMGSSSSAGHQEARIGQYLENTSTSAKRWRVESASSQLFDMEADKRKQSFL